MLLKYSVKSQAYKCQYVPGVGYIAQHPTVSQTGRRNVRLASSSYLARWRQLTNLIIECDGSCGCRRFYSRNIIDGNYDVSVFNEAERPSKEVHQSRCTATPLDLVNMASSRLND